MRTQENTFGTVFRLAQSFGVSQAIYVAVVLRLADHLSDGPKDATTLATLTESDPKALYRLLRLLASVGVFREEEGQVFHQNELSQHLKLEASSTPSVAPYVAMSMRSEAWQAWGELLHSVKTGQGSFLHLFGGTVFDRNSQNEEKNQLFNKAMSSQSAVRSKGILDAYDFGQFSTIVDAGGGRGAFLREILRKHPHVRGTLFDLPNVVAGVEDTLDADLKDRFQVVGGSFFEEIPAGADAYTFKQVIHNWNDEKTSLMLSKCRQAIPDHGKVLIIGADVGEANTEPMAKFMDLNMLVMFDAKERTIEEHEELFRANNFRLGAVTPVPNTIPRLQIIEGIPT